MNSHRDSQCRLHAIKNSAGMEIPICEANVYLRQDEAYICILPWESVR